MRLTGLIHRTRQSASRPLSETAVLDKAGTNVRWGLPRWFAGSDHDWARPVVATVLVVILIGMPHHRLFIWLSDSPIVKYWKEIVFAIGCLAYACVLVRRRGLTRTELRGVLWAAPFVIAVLVRLVVGVLRQEDGHLLLVGGGSHLYYVPIFLLTIYLLDRSGRDRSGLVQKALHWLLIATTLAAALSVVDNFFHISGQFDFFARTWVEARLDYDPEVWRSSATYQSPMVLGMIAGTGFLVSFFLLVTRSASRPRSRKHVGVFGFLMALHLLGMYLTFSRGPLVASAAGATIIGLFGNTGLNWHGVAANWRKITAGIVATVLVLALVIVLLPLPLQRHLNSIFDWSKDQNNVTRLRRISWGLERFGEAPWIGHGLGSAQQRLADYRIQELGSDKFFTNPESQLLSYATEGGILLLVPALLVVGFMVHSALALASSRERAELRRFGVLFLAFQAALYAESLIMPILDTRTFQLSFWVLFGVLVCFRRELEKPLVHSSGQVVWMRPPIERRA